MGEDLLDSEQLDVSVIVPVYNPGEYFQACLDSLVSKRLIRPDGR